MFPGENSGCSLLVQGMLWAPWLEAACTKVGVGVLQREDRDQRRVLSKLKHVFSAGGMCPGLHLKSRSKCACRKGAVREGQC